MTDIDDNTLELLRHVSTATITTRLGKLGIRNVFMRGPRPINPSLPRLVGEAYTLRYIPMREDLTVEEVLADPKYPQRKAIESTPPGAVLVMDCRGVPDTGVLGDILATRLQVRGVAGVVADGPVRDVAEFTEMALPVFCLGGAAPASLTSHHAADLQQPIGCGGVAVIPGDIIVGDEDGVVVIPRALAGEIATEGGEQELMEAFIKSRIEAGARIPGTYPPNDATRRSFDKWKQSQG